MRSVLYLYTVSFSADKSVRRDFKKIQIQKFLNLYDVSDQLFEESEVGQLAYKWCSTILHEGEDTRTPVAPLFYVSSNNNF